MSPSELMPFQYRITASHQLGMAEKDELDASPDFSFA